MEGDSKCWQCGAALKQTAVPTTTPSQPSPTNQENAALPEAQPVSLTAVAYYALATAVSLLLLIWLVRSLNWRPLIQLNPDVIRPRSWTAVTDPDYHFTFNLPPDWRWVTADEQTPFAEQLHRPETQAILASWALASDQLEPKLLALPISDEPLLFLIGEASSTPAATLAEAIQSQVQVQEVDQTTHYLEYEQLAFSETLTANGLPWLCRVNIHVAESNYWIAMCGATDDMSRIAHNTTLILHSFQPLTP
jgi:hypothetical protein